MYSSIRSSSRGPFLIAGPPNRRDAESLHAGALVQSEQQGGEALTASRQGRQPSRPHCRCRSLSSRSPHRLAQTSSCVNVS